MACQPAAFGARLAAVKAVGGVFRCCRRSDCLRQSFISALRQIYVGKVKSYQKALSQLNTGADLKYANMTSGGGKTPHESVSVELTVSPDLKRFQHPLVVGSNKLARLAGALAGKKSFLSVSWCVWPVFAGVVATV